MSACTEGSLGEMLLLTVCTSSEQTLSGPRATGYTQQQTLTTGSSSRSSCFAPSSELNHRPCGSGLGLPKVPATDFTQLHFWEVTSKVQPVLLHPAGDGQLPRTSCSSLFLLINIKHPWTRRSKDNPRPMVPGVD